MSNYTIEKITKVCKGIAKDNGYKLDTPISINGRLRTTLGRVKNVKCGFTIMPFAIEFSKSYVENATDEQVLDTIRHEMAHWLTTTSTGEKHGHDSLWKNWCIKVGANPSRLYDRDTQGQLAAEACPITPAKYKLYCKKCGQLVGSRTRKCKITTAPHLYFSKCCEAGIRVEEI